MLLTRTALPLTCTAGRAALKVRTYTLKPAGIQSYLDATAETADVRKQRLPFLGWVRAERVGDAWFQAGSFFHRSPHHQTHHQQLLPSAVHVQSAVHALFARDKRHRAEMRPGPCPPRPAP